MSLVRNILCVDESSLALKYYQGEFSRYGYEVYTSENLEQIFHCLENHNISCIMLAYELTELNGPEICRQLKSNAKFKDIPIIILTSKEDKKYLLEAIDAGADDFVSKNVDLEIVSSKINAVVRYRDLIRKAVELERFRTVYAMITTMSHEIINPLSIALGMLGDDIESLSEERYEKAIAALHRIQNVIVKIDDLTNIDINFENYADSDELISLSKKTKAS